ncbi:hypothetical protein XM38_020060 [Halomicronema hongdechloris C2206]|uniref:Uncharacterized protein n=1 Tax=Halomicronema hongdechloris C2206 TaxID=1641165 RepID=A0A1Z3HLA7_9CYAN|nr:hypothetical protein [Halomicronema hongdechloris]ASC71056.1 hypothetical protein XM38_020060 [Halomicronema hongdechloris C2206]
MRIWTLASCSSLVALTACSGNQSTDNGWSFTPPDLETASFDDPLVDTATSADPPDISPSVTAPESNPATPRSGSAIADQPLPGRTPPAQSPGRRSRAVMLAPLAAAAGSPSASSVPSSATPSAATPGPTPTPEPATTTPRPQSQPTGATIASPESGPTAPLTSRSATSATAPAQTPTAASPPAAPSTAPLTASSSPASEATTPETNPETNSPLTATAPEAPIRPSRSHPWRDGDVPSRDPLAASAAEPAPEIEQPLAEAPHETAPLRRERPTLAMTAMAVDLNQAHQAAAHPVPTAAMVEAGTFDSAMQLQAARRLSRPAPSMACVETLAKADTSYSEDIEATRADTCSGGTRVLAQSMPEAATAGTPMPGKVLSPTRNSPATGVKQLGNTP